MKKKRTKSTRAAWKEIREAFKGYAVSGKRFNLARDGLCRAVMTVENLSFRQCLEMESDIAKRRPSHAKDLSYYWPLTRSGARHRVKLIDKILKDL